MSHIDIQVISGNAKRGPENGNARDRDGSKKCVTAVSDNALGTNVAGMVPKKEQTGESVSEARPAGENQSV